MSIAMDRANVRNRCNSCNNSNNGNGIGTNGGTNNITNNSLSSIHSEALMQGLNALRCSEKLFDVTLIVENRAFKAHRAVLAACSDYFCAMFNDCTFSESRQSEIELNGIAARGIELLLEYAYTSKLELDSFNIQDVLAASTHVQMKAVIDACSNFLETRIDMENCVGIALLSDIYSLELLKRKVYRFMCSRLDDFSLTSEFMGLTCDQIEHILRCNYPVDCTEQRVLQIVLQYCRLKVVNYTSLYGILELIRYKHINSIELNSVLKDLENTKILKSPNVDDDWMTENLLLLSKILRNKILKQQKQQLLSIEDNCNTHNNTKMMINKNNNKLTESIEIVELLADEDAEIISSAESEDDEDNVDTDDIVSPEILLNSRGMELALVKIGGFETNGLTNQISFFLPSKGKWENLTVIPHIEQCNYGTAVLGNDLYIVGGSYDVCLKEYIHPFGFRYCPIKNKWTTIAPILADRCRFTLNAMGNNYLYAVGGVCELTDDEWHGDVWTGLNCERYNTITDSWENLPPLIENRSQHAGVVLGDKLYISGGFYRHIVLSSMWCLDTKTNKWQQLRSMPSARADHVLLALDNRIYACGGWYEDPETEMRVLIDNIDVYDVDTDHWITETQNPMPKFYTGISAIRRCIYFIGGLLSNVTINRATSAVHCYDIDKKQWNFNSEWEYPKEVWECTCVSFYIPREHAEFDFNFDSN